ncbi:MAG TPA: hypothetical protein VFA89_12110 [Terriglobales bacterium]|nr:hypothetical protein [Terriglobales bacterium]
MKALTLAVVMFLSLPVPRSTPPIPTPSDHYTRLARKGGKWYLSDNGHAVYCYGPVMFVNQLQGGLQRVATFCQGEKPIVPLKD